MCSAFKSLQCDRKINYIFYAWFITLLMNYTLRLQISYLRSFVHFYWVFYNTRRRHSSNILHVFVVVIGHHHDYTKVFTFIRNSIKNLNERFYSYLNWNTVVWIIKTLNETLIRVKYEIFVASHILHIIDHIQGSI